MRVFVTGATGFIGSAVVKELMNAGYEVLGLARSEVGVKSLIEMGAQVHRGDIEDLDSLRRGAAMSDGVIHLAFNHDFSKFQENCETDRRVIETLSSTLMGTDRPLVVTSGVALLPPGQLGTEDTLTASGAAAHPRTASEEAADLAAERGVHVSVVRLAPSVHGDGRYGFVSLLIDIARNQGVSAFVGEGLNRWPAVHRLDAARLFRLAFEKGVAGARYHGVDEEGVPLREIAEVIGHRLNVPIVSKTPEEANHHFGWFSHFAMMDIPSSSQKTRYQLGWQPIQAGLIQDLGQPLY
ncbi:SDR family oxidoreductase [Pelosinus sp. IPA-1]|uniref:SDR family oxidoreductase n=1 Tax=Pelosinus sp. IPA-1 TaxID=3029569 RepID=UPI0024362668|nr:SDR family oxidoreductase [Pelosinus sp. IPA-1]GMA98222.1 3-beta hydroxysteroid dehydrogenase [Pelosinus sp. IPA-1]